MNDNSTRLPYEFSGESVGLFSVPNMTGTPERRLLLAVLERAILDYVGNDDREREEVSSWLFSNQGTSEDAPISLTEVCEALDLDIEMVRERIRLMPRRGKQRTAPWYFPQRGQHG